ncbi:hypothetical protein V1520DRAFT_372460 [Lipomyces starkeyi]|uniref:Uncharacterized protein n=1 Tax=Lipomyces starkeyi NRRL Y-11557 TaxID=675824 RepID=A0A1E3QF06_LIPST|nr:hypothetical protein LIPSTDRAFT_121283 [Lipomyces starkeyi NRRL Y-11557]
MLAPNKSHSIIILSHVLSSLHLLFCSLYNYPETQDIVLAVSRNHVSLFAYGSRITISPLARDSTALHLDHSALRKFPPVLGEFFGRMKSCQQHCDSE